MDKPKLFLASCVSLVTTAMVFAIRGDIATAMAAAFHLTNEQLGLIFSPAFWAFTIAIFISGALVDVLGMRRLHILSAVGYVVGVMLVILAPRPPGPVDSLFDSTGTTLVYAGFFIMGLSQGLVEGVINPLIATIYHNQKTRRLNMLHAWWPGGMIIGGLLAYALTDRRERELGAQAGDDHGAGGDLPLHGPVADLSADRARGLERLDQRNVGPGRQADVPPALRLHVDDGGIRAWPRSVVPDRDGAAGAAAPGRAVSRLYRGLMFVLRFYFSGWAHHEPIRALLVCSALTGIGLYWLGGLQPGTSPVIAFAAATVFGVGKTYLWPTMLGVTAEQFPRGGALLISLMGGTGMLSVAVALPIMGAEIDKFGPGAALQIFAIPTAILVVIFGGLLLVLQGARWLPPGATVGRWRSDSGTDAMSPAHVT